MKEAEKECKCSNCKRKFDLKKVGRVFCGGNMVVKSFNSLRCPFCGAVVGAAVGAEVLPEGEPKEIDRRHIC